ncbi:ATP-binding protein [Actibacterium pelagium]|uniref:Histidine kinase/HSP90-like ATPase domain-containing protein n=1 Tax=Actibacterium pelagium TaxID=2029103 RepID=A0A917ELG2_9RHOB|nr:ATP-binding protein [Actibacterium pelagium]GGE53384.1 hypothetical protein GCM10011517_21380 [Actibacterium pelagium]
METEDLLDLTIHSDLRGVRHGLDRVNTVLVANGYDADLRGSVQILLAEVMNNIVKHAYGEGGQGMIKVLVTVCEPSLQFRITDTGVPLPDFAARPKDYDLINTPVEHLPEGGFGWNLISQIATNLDYCREDDQNILTFEIRLSQHGQGLSLDERANLQPQPGG